MPAGRPTKYTLKLAAEICEKIAGGQPLTKICLINGYPQAQTVYRWLNEKEEFKEMYARAREDQADYMADEIVQLADDANEKNYNAQRLKVDTRKWVAAKLKPRKYGDKQQVEHSGGLSIEVVRFGDKKPDGK